MSRCEMLCRSRDFITHDTGSICSSAPKIEEGIYKAVLLQHPDIFAYSLFRGKLQKQIFHVSKYLSGSSAILSALKNKYIMISNGDVISVSNRNLAK